MPSGHRKSLRHYDLPYHVHELTFSTYKRQPVLLVDRIPQLVLHAIENATRRHAFDVLAYVLMPEHVHLLVHPRNPEYSTARLLAAIKRPSSYRIKAMLKETSDPLFTSLTITERPGRDVFRFWQAGGGYDRNLIRPEAVHKSIDYIHANPIRRGLANRLDAWQWSSWSALNDAESTDDVVTVQPFVA